MCRIKTNQRITTLFNIAVAVFTSMLVGTILSAIIPEKWFVMGCVSVSAVIIKRFQKVYSHPGLNCGQNMKISYFRIGDRIIDLTAAWVIWQFATSTAPTCG